jgi:hypothetical protein
MLSKKDISIRENIEKPGTVETFFKSVYIRKPDDAIVADSLEEFMKKITDPCHIWQGPTDKDGYGVFTVYSKELNGEKHTVMTHRFAYALEHGFDALPKGASTGARDVINHLCHNRGCVNVKHLEVITQTQNLSVEKRKPANV